MKAKRAGPAKIRAIRLMANRTFEGTEEVLAGVVKESTQAPCWRPVRAAAVMGLAVKEAPEDHVWMHTAEFAAWVERFFQGRKGVRLGHIQAEVSIGAWRRSMMLNGAPITRIEALACAHYAAGLPLPFQPLTPELFEAWFQPRFGAAQAVATVIGVPRDSLLSWLKGHVYKNGQRVERHPGAGLIRALDWTFRVGPYSPYGERLQAPAFPGQLMENTR